MQLDSALETFMLLAAYEVVVFAVAH